MRTALLVAAAVLVSAAPAPQTPAISLHPHGEEWQVDFTLPRPATTLHFDIPYETYRQTDWQPVDSAVRIVADGEAVRAERVDGRPFTAASFRLAPHYKEVPKNYAPFSPFSDGGLLVFTGQYHACAGAPCKGGERWRVTVAAPGQSILAGGQSRPGSVTFQDGGDGTLAYAGQAKPLTTPNAYAVIDPALPAPLRAQLDAEIPRANAFFARAFGALLEKPTLFASLDRWPRPNSGLSYQGGTLPGQVFLHFYGSGWRQDASKADFIPWFFAHETAHFYHGARSNNAAVSDKEAWIHEGGAEAFAALAVRDAGGSAYVEQRIAKAATACALGLAALGDRPLNASAEAGAFQNYYDCGLIIQLGIDGDLRRRSNGQQTLVTLWRDFLDKARAGTVYDGESFLAAARRHGLSAATAEAVVALTQRPQKTTGPDLRSRLGV